MCICQNGWEGETCSQRINFCRNVTCFHGGVCRSLVSGFSCECIKDSYSGVYCEIKSRSSELHTMVSRSFVSIAIFALLTLMTFVLILDILKYMFGIQVKYDGVRANQCTKPRALKKDWFIIRYVYVK